MSPCTLSILCLEWKHCFILLLLVNDLLSTARLLCVALPSTPMYCWNLSTNCVMCALSSYNFIFANTPHAVEDSWKVAKYVQLHLEHIQVAVYLKSHSHAIHHYVTIIPVLCTHQAAFGAGLLPRVQSPWNLLWYHGQVNYDSTNSALITHQQLVPEISAGVLIVHSFKDSLFFFFIPPLFHCYYKLPTTERAAFPPPPL